MASNAFRTLLKAVTCLLEFEETISPNFLEHPVIVLIKKIGMAMYKGQYLLTLRAARNDKAFINFFECGSYKKWAILSQHSASKVQFWLKNSIWFKYLQKSQFEFYCQNVFFTWMILSFNVWVAKSYSNPKFNSPHFSLGSPWSKYISTREILRFCQNASYNKNSYHLRTF